jgi:organic hydroperoxide reductase OsmC/OhrA
MDKQHHYSLEIEWTGNLGAGTKDYRSYTRNHAIRVENKVVIEASSDPAFRGDKEKHTPEELFVASIASCHMLWYLHLCADANITVVTYTDKATAIMVETADGGGKFVEVTLYPVVTITPGSSKDQAEVLHKKANQLCFVANSLNFPVKHSATIAVSS